MNYINKYLIITLLVFLISCGGGSSSNDNNKIVSNENIIKLNSDYIKESVTTNNDGKAAILLEVGENISHVSITASSVGNIVKFNRAENDNGVDYLFSGGRALSSSVNLFPSASAINLPSRIQDERLSTGELLYVEISLGSIESRDDLNPLPFQNVDFIIQAKSDDSLEVGNLKTNIYLSGELARKSSMKDALTKATDIFKNIFSSNAGVNLTINTREIEGPEVLPNPVEGSDFYLNAMSSTTEPEINIFIGTDIEFSNNPNIQLLGFSAGIPGSPTRTERSLVAISLLANAGVDGVFNDVEITLLGETLAHETGHYLGLFHPMDISEDGNVTRVDPLADTLSCDSQEECLNEPEIFRNLMFGFPVVDSQGDLIEQFNLTTEQKGVLNSYLAVD